jgi:hypothetical protein
MQHNTAAGSCRDLFLVLTLAGTSFLTAVSLPIGTRPAFSQGAVAPDVDVEEVAKGHRGSKLTGTQVENGAGESIGSINDLIVDRDRILFAIVEVGDYLGVGGFLVAIPYTSMQINEDGSKIVLDQASKEKLQKLPEFKYQQR